MNILRAARNESGERSGVSPPVSRFFTGKLTHAARQFTSILTAWSITDGLVTECLSVKSAKSVVKKWAFSSSFRFRRRSVLWIPSDERLRL